MCTQVTNQSKESQLHLKIVRLSHSYIEIVLIIHTNFLSAYFELKKTTSIFLMVSTPDSELLSKLEKY